MVKIESEPCGLRDPGSFKHNNSFLTGEKKKKKAVYEIFRDSRNCDFYNSLPLSLQACTAEFIPKDPRYPDKRYRAGKRTPKPIKVLSIKYHTHAQNTQCCAGM